MGSGRIFLMGLSSILSLALVTTSVNAAEMKLEDLSGGEVDKFVGDISNTLMHTSVSGAGSLGHIFGFEVGLLVGQAKTPHIQDMVSENYPGVKADKLPHAALLGVLTVPLGITGEINFVPKIGNDDFEYSMRSLAAKWTLTELLLEWPLSFAVKGSHSQMSAEFSQRVTSGMANYDFDASVTTLTALVSKNFILVEPYFGAGIAKAKGDLTVSGAGANSVFDTGVSGKGERSSPQWLAGVELKLLFVKLGAEYSNAFGSSRMTGKLAVYF